MHPLTGPREKLRRAAIHMDDLRGQVHEFGRQNQNKIVVAELEPCGEYYALRAHVPAQPPIQWGTLIGDIAHNLRSALDALMWQLIILNGHPDPSVFKNPRPAFPIFEDFKSTKQDCWVQKGRKHVDGRVRPEHAVVIEQCQPYHTRKERFSISTLWALHELNNVDKHKLMHVVQLSSNKLFSNFMPGNLPIEAELMWKHTIWTADVLEHGAKVGKVHRCVTEKFEPKYLPITDIAFGKGSGCLEHCRIGILHDIYHRVRQILFAYDFFRHAFGPIPMEWRPPNQIRPPIPTSDALRPFGRPGQFSPVRG
jgi:hypothetical protein